MKSISINPRISEQIKSKNLGINTLKKWIWKALLKEYKPKILFAIENLSEKKVLREIT